MLICLVFAPLWQYSLCQWHIWHYTWTANWHACMKRWMLYCMSIQLISDVHRLQRLTLPFWSLKNIEKHTAHTIISWPNPKQWVIVHTSNLVMIIRQSICILSIITREMGKLKTQIPTYRIWITERICLILLTHLTKYIWQAFYHFNVFR